MELRANGGQWKQVGRYAIFQEIATGGMATVHLARFAGPAGFSRVVAIKHLHPHLAQDPDFRTMFVDEVRVTSRVRHRNVVPTLDVVVNRSGLYLVMEYIHGESLAALRKTLRRQDQEIPIGIGSAIMVGVLQGLHAAHEARSESGQLLDIVHRDVSPANILVGADGVPMLLDFGVAKALAARHDTKPGQVKGKAAYMAPEQIRGQPVTRATDIFAASVVLWEVLTGRRLFAGASEHERMHKVMETTTITPPGVIRSELPPEIDAAVLKGLARDPEQRQRTALELAEAIEKAIPPASQRVVAEWVVRIAAEALEHRGECLKQVEISDISLTAPAADETESRPNVVPRVATAPSPRGAEAAVALAAPRPAEPARGRRGLLIAVGATALLAAASVLIVRSAVTPESSMTGAEPVAATGATETSAGHTLQGETFGFKAEAVGAPDAGEKQP